MHRAGTSLTARLLNLLGTELGPQEHLMPAAPTQNPTGFWEHAELTAISDAILAALGGNWRAPPPFPPEWWQLPVIAPIRARACRVLEEEFRGAPVWGWKDPRSALTQAFWEDLVGDMRYVICVRNPRDVALSLAKRDQLPRKQSYRLWVQHMASLVSATSGRPRIVMFYEDYFRALDGSLLRLARFLHGPEATVDPRTLELAREFLDQELWHHHTGASEFVADTAAPLSARSLYALLLTAADRYGGELNGAMSLDALARTLLPPGDSGRAASNGEALPLLLRDAT
jgi:hypothetical protein